MRIYLYLKPIRLYITYNWAYNLKIHYQIFDEQVYKTENPVSPNVSINYPKNSSWRIETVGTYKTH